MMSESIFTSIMEEWADSKWESYANAPEFTTSKKHDRAMRRIFKRYERNARKLRPHSDERIRITHKRIMVLILVIILAVLAGCSFVYAKRTLYIAPPDAKGFTKVWSLHREDTPTYLEHPYCLPELPAGFEITDTRVYRTIEGPEPKDMHIYYENKQTGRRLELHQYTRSEDIPMSYDTKERELIEVDINGYSGVFMDTTDDVRTVSHVCWDDGNYIIIMRGEMPKNELLDLAKSAKLLENEIVIPKN